MSDICIELVVYKVRNAQEVLAARREVIPIIEQFDGFKSWTALQSMTDENVFSDYGVWENRDKAKAAAKQFETDKRFSDFAKTIEKIISFQHYKITDQK